MSWSDNRRISTDIGWYMPYFTTAEYGWQVREPIHDMLIRIIDNTYDPEYMPDYRAEIHFIADQMMAPDRKIDGKDCRYVSTMKKLLVKSFHTLDLSRAQWEYVAPGGEPYPFDESCDDEIISIWYATDPTIVREQSYKAFMKLAYGDWINYDKKCTLVESPKTVVCTAFTRVTVHGTTNGLGTMVSGKNYLEPVTTPIPNGAVGVLVNTQTWYDGIWYDGNTGFTFNSGDATSLVLLFKHEGNALISPSDIADVMLVEGTTIPSAYDADSNLLIRKVCQGTMFQMDLTYPTGSKQTVYSGDNGYGEINTWTEEPDWYLKRCYNFAMPIKANTDYSVRLFNSSYNDIKILYSLFTPPGTITPTFTDCSAYTQKAIPSNGPFIRNEEQWIKLTYSHYRRYSDQWWVTAIELACDVRPLAYKYCDHYAILKAGTYKVMIDCWGNNRFQGSGGYWTGIQDYTGCVWDNYNYDNYSNIYEWFSLIEEDDTIIIPKSKLLPDGITNKATNISSTPPLPNYFHKEVEFTLDHDAKVGLIHRAYYASATSAEPAYFRFMIVDSDVEAEYFQTTGADPAQMQGYSAWEKYQTVVSINVKFTNVIADTSVTLTKTVPSLLYSGDFVDFTEDLPTYYTSDDYGIVIVEVLDKDQEDPTIMPTIDISYH